MQDKVAVNAPDLVRVRVGGQCVAELADPDFADPLVVLVLVVDKGYVEKPGQATGLGPGRRSPS